jgi:hypothetical protein
MYGGSSETLKINALAFATFSANLAPLYGRIPPSFLFHASPDSKLLLKISAVFCFSLAWPFYIYFKSSAGGMAAVKYDISQN